MTNQLSALTQRHLFSSMVLQLNNKFKRQAIQQAQLEKKLDSIILQIENSESEISQSQRHTKRQKRWIGSPAPGLNTISSSL